MHKTSTDGEPKSRVNAQRIGVLKKSLPMAGLMKVATVAEESTLCEQIEAIPDTRWQF